MKNLSSQGHGGTATFLDAVATVDVLTASDNDDETGRNSGNSNCTFCMTKTVVSFWENKQFLPRLLVLENLFQFLFWKFNRKKALTAASTPCSTLASLEIRSRNEEAINSTRNRI